MRPTLDRSCVDGVCVYRDHSLESRAGIVVAFSERGGGLSKPPYDALNLAHHVGDDPVAVDANRERLMLTLGLGGMRDRLVTAEQVHGSRVHLAGPGDAGAGAVGGPGARPPVPGVDALVTTEEGLPILLFFADCVPVVMVAEAPMRGVAVAHAGWRGAAAGVHARAAEQLSAATGCPATDITAYVGPHIMACHFEVGREVLSRFARTSVTISAAKSPLDLGAVVVRDLNDIGVRKDRIVTLARCTAEHTDSLYSYRAEGTTGRHGALAVILGEDR